MTIKVKFEGGIEMQKCWNCKHCIIDYANPWECKKYDDMTELETERYWTNSESGCPYYEPEDF